MARRMANIICSIRRRFTSCKTPAALGSYKMFQEYAELVNNQAQESLHLARVARIQIGRKAVAD